MAITKEQLLTLFPDNTDGDISAADMRAAISALFGNVATPPAYAEGETYYNDGFLNVMGKYDDVIMRAGLDLHRVVLNATGSVIPKGKPCRYDGLTAGKVKVVLAQANSFVNATILGVTAHDIPDGEEGILGKEGDILKMDTSGLPVGVPIYLSETEAGGLTDTAPIIRTQVGGVKVVDAAVGVFSLEIANNVPLPRTLGSLLEATAPTSIPSGLGVSTPITDYSDSIEIVTEVNKVTGIITIPLDGTYRLNVSMHMEFNNVGGAGKKEFYLDLVDITDSITVKSLKGFILKDAEIYTFNDNGAVDLVEDHEYRLEIRSEIALSGFSFSISTFYIESILY